MKRTAIFLLAAVTLAGCLKTDVTIDQKKPIEMNINFKGQLDLVIKDARQDMEKITGEKPTNVVRPEDLGLSPTAGSATEPMENRTLAAGEGETLRTVAWVSREWQAPVALKDDLQAKMAARDKEIRALWDSQAVGESHTGLLVVKGKLSDAHQALVNAENTDRTAFFEVEAKAKNATVVDTALAFYVARLGYAKKGAWYEKKNAAGTWEWLHWGQ